VRASRRAVAAPIAKTPCSTLDAAIGTDCTAISDTDCKPDNAAPAAPPAERYLADGSAEAAATIAQADDPPGRRICLLRRMNMEPGGTGRADRDAQRDQRAP